MNIKLKTFFSLIGLAILFIMFLVLYEIVRLYNVTSKLSLIEHQRYKMTFKADELRQSSDDLTRMARTYLVTNDSQYKDAYFKILDIRNGIAPKPRHYEGIYWDLPAEMRDALHPPEKAISLEEEMKQLPYSKYELQKLKESKVHSDQLALVEIESFRKKNLQTDSNATLSKVLYSKDYHDMKAKIMLPIDQFLSSLRQRTYKEIQKTHLEIQSIYDEIIILFLLFFIIVLSVVYVLRKKILEPIEYLHKTILAFKNNEVNIKKRKFYQDEIGQVIEQFFRMKEKIDADNVKLHKLATTDPLTHIYNRRAFFDIANSFFSLVQRDKTQLAILILDIDYFKSINDTYGHVAGDKVLKHLVQTVQKCLRKSDIFARYGGEEFIILLPDADINAAQNVAQKIRTTVQNTPFIFKNGEQIPITVSIGCSQFQRDDTDLNDIIARADSALYAAKKNGRNRVEIA
jgi:diguanylate cyclase (GGDEF)-like protein